MSVHIHIEHTLRSASRYFELHIQLQTSAQRIALFGPSGSGKTLTIQALAGLLTPNLGRIEVSGQVFFDAVQLINKSPQQRKLAYLLQDYGLFPHLTVKQNIAFGLRKGFLNPSKRGLPKEAMYWVQAFELEAILNNYPDEISGGQKQRTALARALAVSPELLLLDEPLAALDQQLRVRMRQELVQLQQKLAIPSIIITHDPADAIMLADEVYCIAEGRIVKQCRPEDLL